MQRHLVLRFRRRHPQQLGPADFLWVAAAPGAALLPLAPMVGVKEFNTNCTGYEDDVAQAPDGLFLTCAIQNNESIWVRGDA